MDKPGSGDSMARPLGPLKGLTDEADEFAQWLRKITAGVTVRTLETHFPYGKSSWSAFRDGSKLPTPQLVEQVTQRYVREPAMRAQYTADGLRLLAAAQQAAKTSASSSRDVPVPRPRQADLTHEAFLRLDDARQWQLKAMEQLAASERQRRELEDTVSFLQERCTRLESERDRAREDARAELQHELQMSLEYQRQADDKLEQARRAEQKAYQLRLAAENKVTLERMALRHILHEDRAQEPAPEPGVGPSIAQELNLPPLDQVHAFLEAKQRQLDDQDDDLAHLGEQISQGAVHTADDREQPTRLVEGRVVGNELRYVQHHPLDNAGKPLNSEDGPQNLNQNVHGHRAGGSQQTPTNRVGEELVTGLQTVSTPAALSTALSRLLQRAGRQSIANLTKDAFPGSLKDDLLLMTVMRWIDGQVLPDTWPHLESLVRAIGATDREVEAFRQAYTRIVDNFPTGPDTSPDLAELPSTPRGLTDIARRLTRPPAHKQGWLTAVLAPCTIAVLTTSYTAGLQADPGPEAWKLTGYGALALLGCVLALLTTLRPPPAERGRRAETSLVGMGLSLSLLTLPAGLILPWALNSDAAGHWLAALVGLL
ncbi:hypothetical protein [Streptomyces noursei]|uniref:hypothetical protein n=2 Tax=Streptomyces TaxID=1883 RepID=UPI00131E3A28